MKNLELVSRSLNSYSFSQVINSRIKRYINYWVGPMLFIFALSLIGCGGSDSDSDSEDETPSVTMLDFASLPSTGQTVSPEEEALFEVTGLTPGTLYSVSIAGTNGVNLGVFDDSNIFLCDANAFTGSGSCIAAPSDTSVFLRVTDRSGSGATFTLDMIVAPVTVLDFASLPATGQTVSPSGETLFEITGLTPGTLYSVSIAGTRDIHLGVFDDSDLVSFLCESFASTGSGNCLAAPSGTSVFLRVRDLSGLGGIFILDVIVAPVTVLDFVSLPATRQTVSPSGDKLFEITGLTPGALYSVSIAEINDVNLSVYDDSDIVSFLCSSFPFTGSGSCITAPSGTSLFLRVTDRSGSGDTFTLDVIVAPVTVLDFASLPATGQTVSPRGDTLFEITGLTPETLYSVSIAGTNGVSLRVYDNPDLVGFLCSSFASTGSGNCSAAPTSTSLFLRVEDRSLSGDTFTLDVMVAIPTVLDLKSLPATGQTLSPGGDMIFEITGLTPGTLYSVSIAGTNGVILRVSDDSDLVSFLCIANASTGSGSCSAAPSGTSVFLRVTDTSGSGDIFTLDVTAPLVTVLDFVSLPATGQTVSPGEDMLFEITGLTPGTLYSVSIAGTNGINLRVYDDPDLVSFLCNSFASSGSGNCIAAPSGTSIFLRVTNNSSLADIYTLDVIVAPVTVLDFVSLPATGQTLSPGGDMLFEITGLTPGTLYSVSIAGTSGINLRVYDDPDLVSFLCDANAFTGSGNCIAAPSGTSLFLRVGDLSGLGDIFILDVIVAPRTVLDFASLPATGQTVSPSGDTLFEITGLTPGTLYSVSIAGTNSISPVVFDDPDLVSFLCNSFASSGSGNCIAAPSGTSIFLRVTNNSSLADIYTLDVIVAPVTVLDFANLPATGQTLSPGGDMLFEITGLTPGTLYSVSIAGTNGINLNVSDDPDLVIFLCSSFSLIGSVSCNAAPSGTSVFLRVTDRSGLGDTFTLDVIAPPPPP